MKKHIAIFGSTGYIGTKILIELYNRGYRVTLFARNIRKLFYLNDDCQLLLHKFPNLCLVETPVEESRYEQIKDALVGVDAVYYLVHSLNIENGSFLNKDNHIADLVATAARQAGVEQIIYLGGLGVNTSEAPLSEHLQSRHETGDHLRSSHPNVTEFRAGVIIGEGSASFELIRSLGTKLPFIPDLGEHEGYCQPVFVNDVIDYLLYGLLNPRYYGKIAEIGCEEVLHYSDIVKVYAKSVNNKHLSTIRLPFINLLLTPKVISWFASRMSGMPYILIYRLIEGSNSNAVVHDYPLKGIDPDAPVKPLSLKEAIRISAKRCEEGFINSLWSTPYELSVLNAEKKKQFFYATSQETDNLIFDEYAKEIPSETVNAVFERIKSIGGKNGYYSTHWLWEVRGIIDMIFGGPGLNQQVRRSPKLLRVGDHIDFWVVTYYKNTPRQKVLRLKANMKTPGNAWLQFSIEQPEGDSKALLILRPYFDASGIFGYLYWYSLYFIHKIIFKQMLNNLAKGKQ